MVNQFAEKLYCMAGDLGFSEGESKYRGGSLKQGCSILNLKYQNHGEDLNIRSRNF